jgi:peptide/nickel transport system permease protein
MVSRYERWLIGMRARKEELRLSFYIIRRNPLALTGLAIIALFSFIAVFGEILAPYNPVELNLAIRFQPPTWEHLFGTDELGRDILSRILSGAKYSMATWIIVLGLSVPFGTLLGLIAGYLGGKYDELIMRVTDVFLAFPSLILSLAVSAALGPSLTNAMLALSIVWWPSYTRLVRAQALYVRKYAFIEAAKSMGASHLRIILSHLLPNCVSPLIVSLTQEIGLVILFGASLSFLGFGAQPPLPEWGRMITEGRIYIFQAWWTTFFPGIAILLVVLAFNLLGDTFRDLLDPRLRRVIEVKGK